MRVGRRELKERLCKRRGVYTSHLVDTLCGDLEDLGWVLFDESTMKRKLDDLETNILYDVRAAPVEWVRRFKKEIFG